MFWLLALLITPAAAQQPPPDPAFLQKAVGTLQMQRNQALDAATIAESKLQLCTEETAKLKAEIEALKKAKPNEKK